MGLLSNLNFGGGNEAFNSASQNSTNNETNNYDQRVINETSNANEGQFAGSTGDIQFYETDNGAVFDALNANKEVTSEAYAFAARALDSIGVSQELEAQKLQTSLQGLGELSADVASQGTAQAFEQLTKMLMIAAVGALGLFLFKGK